MGIMQHHDAVAGTEQEHVAKDYSRLLHQSFDLGEQIASKSLKWVFDFIFILFIIHQPMTDFFN